MCIVVAYSPSDQGDAALRAAAEQARRRALPLVVASHSYVDGETGRRTADEADVRRRLAELGPAPAGRAIRSSADPDVAGFLLRLIADEGASLVVIGLRGKSTVGKLALGATARRVVLSATCPVLAVKSVAA